MKCILFAALAAVFGGFLGGVAKASDENSVVRGGRLYDNWSREAKERTPLEVHPAFRIKAAEVAPAETWRCKECHGWDYNGRHGMAGMRGRRGSDPAAIVSLLKDATHRYAGLLRAADLVDLANFVSRGQADIPAIVKASKRHQASASSFEKFYQTLCAGCHGNNGDQLRDIPPLGDAARQRPQEVAHVMFNGHPGGVMPALSAHGEDFAARMLSYLQTLPTPNLSASIAHGGRLYDNWQTEERLPRQALPHPTYPKQAYYFSDAPLTWRCKECHGWDYRGTQGNYGSGRHATGIKGISGMQGTDPRKILPVLRNAQHQYGAVLKERDLLDLANFVSAGQVDMEPFIEPSSRKARGIASRGGPYYRTMCSGCHGIDGHHTAMPALGPVARTNPWGSFHTIINGHPNEKMPALRELGMPLLSDILAYVQELPESR